jgi:hypothetical protein
MIDHAEAKPLHAGAQAGSGDLVGEMAEYAPEGVAALVFLLAPPALGVVSFWSSARGHWLGPALAAPALLFGLAFTWALLRGGPGYGVWVAVVYGPLLLILAMASIVLWERRRVSREDRS